MALNQFDPFSYKDPPRFDVTPSYISDTARSLVSTTASVCQDIVNRIKPEEATFNNTIRPLAEDENTRSERENHLRFFTSTSPIKELRDASNAAVTILNDGEIDFCSQRNLFLLIDSIMDTAQKSHSPPIDDQSMYYLTKLHRRFLANGCGIVDDAVRNDLVAKKKRINDLARECRKNMADERTGIWLTREELQGIPISILDRLKTGDGEYNGRLWLPTKTPFTIPGMDHVISESTRQKIHYAVINRMPDNIPLFREMTLLRDETARLLGWPNHFAFKTSQKMVKTPETVKQLLSEIRKSITPLAERLANELLALKSSEAEARGNNQPVENLKLFYWDRSYFLERLGEKTRRVDAVIPEYFELDTTLHKLLAIYEHLLGVRFVPVDTAAHAASGKQLVWHEDVRMFSAWKVDGESPEFLAYAYLDFFPREGKFTHVGQYTLQRVNVSPTFSSRGI